MRIIGGKYRGRIIRPPRGLKARPTTDYAREGLFNILVNRIDFEETRVLDLFSGTGAMGIEFISRGSSNVDMVEINSRHSAFISTTLKELGIDNAHVIHTNVLTFLRKPRREYDLVFADPPYNLSWLKEIPSLIEKSRIMADGGLLILEHPSSFNFSADKSFYEHRKYGNVNFSFFRYPKQ